MVSSDMEGGGSLELEKRGEREREERRFREEF
jgi:hypothetical protein